MGQVDESDEFLIIATDGVWDVVDNNHAVQMVQNLILKSASSSSNGNSSSGAGYVDSFFLFRTSSNLSIYCVDGIFVQVRVVAIGGLSLHHEVRSQSLGEVVAYDRRHHVHCGQARSVEVSVFQSERQGYADLLLRYGYVWILIHTIKNGI